MPETLPAPAPDEPVFLAFAHEGQPAPCLPTSAELPTAPAPVYLPTTTPAPTV
jgi:hypothetical protein